MNVGDSQQVTTIVPLEQGTSKNCWATCYAMMLQYKGQKNTKADVQALLDKYKADADFKKHLEDYAAAYPNMNIDVAAEMDMWTYGSGYGLQKEQFKYGAKAIGL